MPFGQPVLDIITTPPTGTTKLSKNKTLKLNRVKIKKKRTTRGDVGEGDEVQKKKREPDGRS